MNYRLQQLKKLTEFDILNCKFKAHQQGNAIKCVVINALDVLL